MLCLSHSIKHSSCVMVLVPQSFHYMLSFFFFLFPVIVIIIIIIIIIIIDGRYLGGAENIYIYINGRNDVSYILSGVGIAE